MHVPFVLGTTMAQSADHLGERGSGHHPRPVRGCWSLNISVLQLPVSAGRLAVRRTAGLETSERVTWATGDAVGTVWSAFAGEKIALIQRVPKLYRMSMHCNEY